jgi:type II secretory pathway pseudopilin PulG
MKTSRNRCGFIFVDAIIGLALVGVLLSIIAVSMTRRQQALRELAEQRNVERAAEAALNELHAGRTMPPSIGDVAIKMTDAPGGTAPAGYRWVQVQAVSGKRTATLVGVIAGGGK